MGEDVQELCSVVRRLHVHYDVAPELEITDGARVKVALVVRLWGVHARGARALPGCPKCHELRRHLERIADYVLPGEPRTVLAAIEPLRAALYDSRVLPGADEIALAIRLAGGDARTPQAQVQACEERCMKEIRARLRELGVPER